MKNFLHIIFSIVLFFAFHLHAQTTNIDFELTSPGVYTTPNTVSGWTVSSQTTVSNCATPSVWVAGSSEFSIVSTPIIAFPDIGNIFNSPLGGTHVARLNNSNANNSATKLTRNYYVTSSNTLFQFAYAGVWEGANSTHVWCDQSAFKLNLKDQLGNILTCFGLTVSPGAGNQSSGVTFTYSPNGTCWNNWQLKTVDLTPYLNSQITIEVICNDCGYGDHFGTLFFDALLPYTPPNVSFCAGSPYANICGPLGEATYSWVAAFGQPPIPYYQSTLSCLAIPNPSPGANYTLNVLSPAGCAFTFTYSLIPATITIGSTTASPTCSGGSGGSATVIANGSSTGYNYSWINATNSVVGTSSVITALVPGIYTVTATSPGSPGCGSPSATVSIGTTTMAATSMLKPYCGNVAYFTTSGGSNFQWYNSSTSLTPTQGGNAPSLALASPVNGSHFYLGFNSTSGCRDSIIYTLVSVPSGSIGITNNPVVCPNATNGLATIILTPASGSPPGLNSYSVFSTGTTPAYTATLNPTAANTFSAYGLTAGGTYSVNAFDGSCRYSTSFSVTPFIFNYSVSASASTLCPGFSAFAAVSFSSPVFSQYTYSWTPSTFILGPNASNVIITPSIPSGTIATLIYSVTVTPTLVNCPITKTISVTAVNPATPTISSIPILCSNSPLYTISVNPPGGLFTTTASGLSGSGIIAPTITPVGNNSFTYTTPPLAGCTLTTTGNYTLHTFPLINPLGNQLSICNGQSTTLSVTTVGSYSWSNGAVNSSIMVTPGITTSYSVSAMNFANTCSNTAVLTVTVIPVPTVSILSNTLVCFGKTTTITAAGATTYTWSNGAFSPFIVISPNTNISYTVTGIKLAKLCLKFNCCKFNGDPESNTKHLRKHNSL